ncbi:hypothetical protein [Ruania albidiflava]|uniref:hypothetical protein n=1 Tax=Ruania albidiflava TaxID=366586 RepID=UPI0004218E74|nr:hypothetical protein [Ruania albidiflava]
MTSSHSSDVLALVAAHGWRPEQVRAVSGSLAGQVGRIQVLSPSRAVTAAPPRVGASPDAPAGFVLVVTAPVVFARGAVRRLLRMRTQSTAVVRVLLPEGGPADVALWSQAWLQTEHVGTDRLLALGLDFDRERMPAGDPRVRIWTRGDDLGIVPLATVPAPPARWARAEGGKLWLRAVLTALRGRAGAVRRARQLARQRRGRTRRGPF